MPLFDPSHPDYYGDPHGMLRRLREQDPVHRAREGYWVLTRYADVVRGLKDPGLGASRTEAQFRALYGSGPTYEFASRRFQYFDPPAHTRIRKLVVKAFTLRRVEGMRPRMQALTDRLFDAIAGEAEFDIMAAVAHPLPANVICEMLGVPEADQPLMSKWASTIPFIIAPIVEKGRLADADAAIANFFDYITRLVEERRRSPGEDLLTALMAAEEDGDRLTHAELLATVVFMFSAGHHTTRNLAGNGLLALLRGGHWRRLVDNPALIPSAVEECLRYEPSINFAPRRALRDVEFGGTRIPAGELVYLSLPGANRDPARFPDPDRFDITRQDNDHVAFGGGIHHCLGASLARAEVQILFGTLVRRLPRLELAGGPVVWRPAMSYRGLEALHVRRG